MLRTRTIFVISALIAVASCSRKTLQAGSESKEALVQGFIAALTTGNQETVRQYLVRKQEYVEAIHPHTPEAKGVPGSDWWDTMIIRKRDILTSGLLEKFSGKTCSVEISGKEKGIEKHGPVTFYREIPVRIACGDKENFYSDETRYIFGIVVEKYGVWKLLNIFND